MAPSYDGVTAFTRFPPLTPSSPTVLIRVDLPVCDVIRKQISVVTLETDIVTSHTNQALS